MRGCKDDKEGKNNKKDLGVGVSPPHPCMSSPCRRGSSHKVSVRSTTISWFLVPGSWFLKRHTLVCAFLWLIILAAIISLVSIIKPSDILSLFQEPYTWHVIGFTLLQAALSVVLSVGLGFLIAQAFFYSPLKWGNQLILRIASLSFAFPSILVALALIGLYGRAGWWASLSFPLYGIGGILLAHTFLNLPFCVVSFYNALQKIPLSYYYLLQQHPFSYRKRFLLAEWPQLKITFRFLSFTVFSLCLSSFVIILIFGGGPKYTTLEVYTYQFLRLEFHLSYAAILALTQALLAISINLILNKDLQHKQWRLSTSIPLFKQIAYQRRSHKLLIICFAIFMFSPVLHFLLEGLYSLVSVDIISQASFWFALKNSLFFASTATILANLFAFYLVFLLLTTNTRWIKKLTFLTGFLGFFCPSFVLSTGLFIFLHQFGLITWNKGFIIVLSSLMVLPFAFQINLTNIKPIFEQYHYLWQALHLSKWQIFAKILLPLLKHPLGFSFSLCFCLVLSELSIILLIGSQDTITLSQLLYLKMAHYRFQDAAAIGTFLLLCAGFVFGISHLICYKKSYEPTY